MKTEISLFVEVPICAFRPYESREYQDTYPAPPPSSVYGMLLSLCGVGRDQKDRHRGVIMALAIESEPVRSKVFRKLRRGKELGDLRPDYQDILLGLSLWVWLADGNDQGSPKLPALVAEAIEHPATVKRFGGLSLGESSYLVNSVRISQPSAEQRLLFLKPDETGGFYSLPVWIDHAKNQSIRRRFDLKELSVAEGLAACCFFVE